MKDQETIFEAYLKEQMSSGERSAFEERLANEPDLKEAFKEFKAAFLLIQLAGERELKGVLHEIHEEVAGEQAPEKGRVIPIRRNIWIAAAASVALLVAIFLFNSGPATTDELYAEHLSAYELPDVSRDDSDDPWADFTLYYLDGDHSKALHALEIIPEGDTPKYLIELYRGICLQLKEDPYPLGAVEALGRTLASDNDFHDVALWYLGLAHMKLGDTVEAKRNFKKLVKMKGYRYREAEDLIEDMPDLPAKRDQQ